MKVLFAVSNEKISEAIVKKYQKDYKEIISYKNVYYFNAILKEIQRDKTYDRIVISEDLEPFANNDYEAIDKFIFEKLDNISDEATNREGEDTPIILICSDRRAKSEQLLVKIFGIGVYSALLGQDRSISQVCELLKKPRSKKEAKIYYKIESEDVGYQAENEESVSEVEIQNILMHYKKLGKDENAYIESFNRIAAQYTDSQLKLIIKFLPINVKAVLETQCPKYQEIMAFSGTAGQYKGKITKKEENKQEKLKINFIENQLNKEKSIKQVIVPSAVDTTKVRKLSRREPEIAEIEEIIPKEELVEEVQPISDELVNDVEPIEEPILPLEEIPEIEGLEEVKPETPVAEGEPPKRKRGRPRKIKDPEEVQENLPKRKRGRPRKVDVNVEQEEANVPSNPVMQNQNEEQLLETLPGLEEPIEEKENTLLPGIDETEEITDTILPGMDEEEEETPIQPISDFSKRLEPEEPFIRKQNNYEDTETTDLVSNALTTTSIESQLTKDKKIVAFVGTTKNGTSFIVNNLAQVCSDMGIKTAILDVTQNKNSYYIYTKNEEQLRNTAINSMVNLARGIPEGIQVSKNLTVYTSLPTAPMEESSHAMLETLVKNYALVLIDCDFDTPIEYFQTAQEIYLVQSMDILTIQPLTGFLRELKAKNALEVEKFKVIINKSTRVRSLNPKLIIGGISYYNDPAMSFITELLNKDKVKYYTIPFDEQVYVKYLEGLVECKISLSGYPKKFMLELKELANNVYPLLSNKYKPVNDYKPRKGF